MRGLSEGLRHELRGTPVGLSVVHPGGIRTNIARRARQGLLSTRGAEEVAREVAAFERGFITSPREAAARILRGVERAEGRVLIGRGALGSPTPCNVCSRCALGRFSGACRPDRLVRRSPVPDWINLTVSSRGFGLCGVLTTRRRRTTHGYTPVDRPQLGVHTRFVEEQRERNTPAWEDAAGLPCACSRLRQAARATTRL